MMGVVAQKREKMKRKIKQEILTTRKEDFTVDNILDRYIEATRKQ
jgi:hypothetical protein